MRVGGSAWELKIDTKRLEEKENNDFEKESHRREVKKNINIARRGPEKEVCKLKGFGFFFLEARRGARGFGPGRPGGVPGAPPEDLA